MNNLRIALRYLLGAVFGLCAADGILQVRGMRLMPAFWENTVALLFFVIAGVLVYLAVRQKDEAALKRLRLWSFMVLFLSVAVLLIMAAAMSMGAGETAVGGLAYALVVVSAPTASASRMFLPIMAWAGLCLVSHRMIKRLPGKAAGEHGKN